jgi:hypothetical protein
MVDAVYRLATTVTATRHRAGFLVGVRYFPIKEVSDNDP